MGALDFPVWERVPHFEVVTRWRGRWELTNQRLYRCRADADRYAQGLREDLSMPGDGSAKVIEYEAACYVRCVVCGEFPSAECASFPDWADAVQYVDASPGWTHTSEHLVFCPHHRPNKED